MLYTVTYATYYSIHDIANLNYSKLIPNLFQIKLYNKYKETNNGISNVEFKI